MLFTAFNFLIFFPIITCLYYFFPKKYRWFFLLVVSIFFYINIQPVYAVLLCVVALITYFFTLLIDKETSDGKRYRLQVIAICLILIPLFFFKYYNFVNEMIFSMLETIGLRFKFPEMKFLLPIGISYYTFMAIGYVIDVYNEETEGEKNFGLVLLFLSFFPLVLSGPIERAKSMITQFKGSLDFDYTKTVNGLQLMIWGYFLKLVIADRLSIYTDIIFSDVHSSSGSTILLGVLLYPFQIYGDLGGYSLMAIGAANVLGINVRPNFNRPFFATSMSELWRKWHMSLITWITDYLYTPIAFALRKYKIWGIVFALMITFLIAGIWHGATVAFIVWGLMQGGMLCIEALTRNKKNVLKKKYNLEKNKIYILVSTVFTYLFFAFALLFGVATQTLKEPIIIMKKIFTDTSPIYLDQVTLGYASIGILMLFLSEFRDEFFPNKLLLFKNKNVYIRWLAYISVVLLILSIGVFGQGQFIYFKF